MVALTYAHAQDYLKAKSLCTSVFPFRVTPCNRAASYNAIVVLLQVPELWARAAYPSLKPLGSWVADYAARVAFVREWLAKGPPACFWLPGACKHTGVNTGMLGAFQGGVMHWQGGCSNVGRLRPCKAEAPL